MEITLKRTNCRSDRAAVIMMLLLLVFTSSSFAQVNKCKINGKIVYTDKACPDNTKETLDLSKSSFSTTPSLAPSTARKFSSATSTSNGSSQMSSSGWLQDKSGYDKAVKESTRKGVPIFIYGYTDWCGYCKKLQKGLFRDPSVKRVLDRFIKVKINPEHSVEDNALFSRWGGRGYPTLFTQATASSSPSRTNGPFAKVNGNWEMMKAREFISMLQSRL